MVALATTDAIWDLNLETKIVWWSAGIEQLFGYRPADVSPRLDWWLDRLHPEDKDRVAQELERVAESGGRTWAGHYRFRRQDGTYASVLDRGYLIHDAAGKPTRVVGGISDISERRRAEEALEGSRRQLRALTARIQSGREEERANVAREIHDELGQVLTAIKMNLDWLELRLDERGDAPAVNPLLERVPAHYSCQTSAPISFHFNPKSYLLSPLWLEFGQSEIRKACWCCFWHQACSVKELRKCPPCNESVAWALKNQVCLRR